MKSRGCTAAVAALWILLVHASPPLPLDARTAHHVFDGIGALSAGASSRLLVDYPEPQRADVLDLLFKPSHGASLQILKVEVSGGLKVEVNLLPVFCSFPLQRCSLSSDGATGGPPGDTFGCAASAPRATLVHSYAPPNHPLQIGGDAQSTDGSEASIMHTRDDLNCGRGYENWLLTEAKRRNPAILTYGLSWAVPRWVGDGSGNGTGFHSPDNWQYQTQWLACVKNATGVTVDWLGIWSALRGSALRVHHLPVPSPMASHCVSRPPHHRREADGPPRLRCRPARCARCRGLLINAHLGHGQ